MGFATIADIGKERIRRAFAKVERTHAGQLELNTRETCEDLGFRVFKLAASNFRSWQGIKAPDPESYEAQMALFSDLLVGEWTPANVICEVALKEGYGLSMQVETVGGISSNTVYRVTDRDRGQLFRICLDSTLEPEAIEALSLGTDDLFICRDMALSDALAANLALQCHLKTL